jgi:hypothetical protein
MKIFALILTFMLGSYSFAFAQSGGSSGGSSGGRASSSGGTGAATMAGEQDHS